MKSIFALLAVVSTALAVPAQLKRQFGNCCGNVCYSNAQIQTALNTGFTDFERGSEPGGYPHTYNNFEGFDFTVRGPYQEFPILSSGRAYNGGSPGADRVIFNTGGSFAGLITHTGASGNDFVGCDG